MTEDRDALPILWYFADPMCSWCWGFAPVIQALKQDYADRIRISLNLGGLRPGTTGPLGEKARGEILHHWHQVHDRTGQPFKFEGALPETFVYDTEPASRAVLAFGALDADRTLAYFAAVQSAFYADGRDVTQFSVLSDIARGFELDADAFETAFSSGETRSRTQAHFARARRAGVRGFPTTVWQHGDQVALIAGGYMPYPQVAGIIDARLAAG